MWCFCVPNASTSPSFECVQGGSGLKSCWAISQLWFLAFSPVSSLNAQVAQPLTWALRVWEGPEPDRCDGGVGQT